MCRNQFSDATAIKDFVLAGNATITLVSLKTDKRYTFRIRKPNDETPHFVSVLFGPDNTEDYQFLGSLFNQGQTYRHGRRSTVYEGDIRVLAWNYMWDRVLQGRLPANLEVWHEGKCGRCGRALTVPESIERGIGPVCKTLMAA